MQGLSAVALVLQDGYYAKRKFPADCKKPTHNNPPNNVKASHESMGINFRECKQLSLTAPHHPCREAMEESGVVEHTLFVREQLSFPPLSPEH